MTISNLCDLTYVTLTYVSQVRFWLTAGTGNLGVTPTGCTTRLYVLVFGGLPRLQPLSSTHLVAYSTGGASTHLLTHSTGGLPGLQPSDGDEGFAEVALTLTLTLTLGFAPATLVVKASRR